MQRAFVSQRCSLTPSLVVLAFCLGLFAMQGRSCLAAAVVATIDPPAVSVGEELTLTLTIEGSLEREPEVPAIAGVDVTPAGQGSSMSYVSGRGVTKTANYYYRLLPQAAGDYTVPAIRLRVDGSEHSSRPLSFRVQADGANQALPGDTNTGEGLPLAFVERTVSKTDPYEGEGIISTVKIYTRIDVNGLQKAGKDSPDFRYEEIGQVSGRERVGDAIFEVITYQQVLIPQKAGNIELPPYQLDAQLVMPAERGRRGPGDLFSEFFGRGFGKVVKKRLASQPINLRVRPIPQEGRPKNYQGLVGQFTLHSQLNPRSLKQGETATLTINLQGIGLLDPLGQNLDLALPNQVKLYADKPEGESKADQSRGMMSRRTYKYALVPNQGGTVDLGRLAIPVFDPEKKQFTTLTAELGQLDVEAIKEERVVVGSGVEHQQTRALPRKAAVQSLSKDLIDLHRQVRLDEAHTVREGDWAWLLSLFFAPSTAYLASLLWLHRRRLRQADPVAQRRSRAYKSFRQEAQSLRGEVGAQGADGLLNAYYGLYRRYLGDRFDARGGALTLRDMEEHLGRAGLAPDEIAQARQLALAMDELNFSGKTMDRQKAEELIACMDKLVGEVEKRC